MVTREALASPNLPTHLRAERLERDYLGRLAHDVDGLACSQLRHHPTSLAGSQTGRLGTPTRLTVQAEKAGDIQRTARPNRHKPGERFVTEYRDQPMGVHGLHDWWYGCLERAGVAAKGQRSGERMHKARHTAGQRVLDATHGNIKAVSKLLGHSSLSTTADIYTDWDIDQLTETLRAILEEAER